MVCNVSIVSTAHALLSLNYVQCEQPIHNPFPFTENCPDHDPSLSSWNPGHLPEKAVFVRRGHLFRLESSATFLSITIQSGGETIKILLFVDFICRSFFVRPNLIFYELSMSLMARNYICFVFFPYFHR